MRELMIRPLSEGKFLLKGGEETLLEGNVPERVFPGVWYLAKVSGSRVYTFREYIPEGKELAIYLASYPLSKREIKKLLPYGIETLESEESLEERGIPRERAERIAMMYAKRVSHKREFSLLRGYYFTDSEIYQIVKFGTGDNPYSLITEGALSPTLFPKVEKYGKQRGFSDTDPTRLKAYILYTLSKAEEGVLQNLPQGSTWCPLEVLKNELNLDRFDEFLSQLAISGRVFLVRGNTPLVALKETCDFERETAKRLASFETKDIPSAKKLSNTIERAEATLGISLSYEQQCAVKTALMNPFSVLTGGPGTGKTSVQRVLLWTYQTLYPQNKIALAAPTGRAAKRMMESTGTEATTLHRLLGIGYDGKELRAVPWIDADLIAVDEASMLDASLFSLLIKKVRVGSRLLLIGDVDQLPSVGAGAVLSELIQSGSIPVARLTKVFRQEDGSSIAVNAARVKTGQSLKPKDLVLDDSFRFIQKESSKEIAEEVENLFCEIAKDKGLDSVACLAAYRRNTETGVNKINERLKKHFVRGNKTYKDGDYEIAEGMRVMFTRNTRTLLNGDTGIVTGISENEITCDFDGNVVSVRGQDRKYLVPAFATTVHKSQGSEYPVVIMICDKAHKRMLKRNLLYTGITRAKKQIIMVGDFSVFSEAVTEEDTNKRISLLGRFIKEAVK